MTQNADIRRHYEGIAQQYHQLRRRVEKVENAPADLRNAAIDGGRGLLVKSEHETIRLGDTGIEHQGGPAPEQPEAPFVDAGGETVKIQHSGLDVHESPAPANFRRAQVHVSQDETFEPGLSTLAGYMDSANGSMTHRLPGGEWYIGVVWETRSGKHSPMSDTSLADVAPLVDADEIQEALDEAAERLAEAEQDFQEGNEARKQEIENLRDNVIPGLRESLNDKADQSALDDLDDKLDNIDIPDLSGVPTKDQVDEAVKAAENAAKEHADLVSQGAKDDAIAEAEAKANAAKEAAEQAAKDYTDQAKADAAADAQEKADAAREHADKLVGELDFSDFAHVWRQDDPPPAGTTYEWTDGAHASPSAKRVDGEETARNLFPDPQPVSADTWSAIRADLEFIDGEGVRLSADGTSGQVRIDSRDRITVEAGQMVALAADVRSVDGVEAYVGILGYSRDGYTGHSPRTESHGGSEWRRVMLTFEVPEDVTSLLIRARAESQSLDEGATFDFKNFTVAVADSEDAALAQVQEYFDGDTSDEREKDLWIDKAGLPHFWKKGWGWAVLDDERISKALNDADKAQKTADEAHSEAGEAKSSADAAMDRAGAAEDYADGLPKVLHGTSAPSGTAPDGSVWFQHQDSLSGAVVGQWNMTDGSWQSTPIDSEAIANLDVGKLTVGSADLAEAVVGKIWGQLGVFDRLDARQGWIGGVALEDGAVGAKQVNVEDLFADEAVIDTVWADIVRAKMLTAEEAFIGGALIKNNTIDVEKINVTEELTAAIGQFLHVKADMIEANAIDADKIAAGAIEAGHLAGRIIKGEHIAANTITSDEINAQRFRLESHSGNARTVISPRGLSIISDWAGYPDPTFENPALTAARKWESGGWTNYYPTNSRGIVQTPDLREYVVSVKVNVTNTSTAEVRFLGRETTELSSSYVLSQWRPGVTGSHVVTTDRVSDSTLLSRPYFTWVGLYGGVTIKEMWVTPKNSDSASEYVSLAVSGQGIEAWDAEGTKTVSIDGESNYLAGRFFTNVPGAPGAILNNDYGSESHQGPGLWFSEDGSMSYEQPAIWIRKDDNNYYTEMVIRGRRYSNGNRASTTIEGGLTVTGGMIDAINDRIRGLELVAEDYVWSKDQLITDGHATFNNHAYFNREIVNSGVTSVSSSANVSMTGSGRIQKTSSIRASKVNIDDVQADHPERILELEPRIWLDRTGLQELLGDDYSDYVWGGNQYSGPQVDESKLKDRLGYIPRRVAGLIAEEVVEAGLDEYAAYDQDDDGQEILSGIDYDRLWTLLIPLVREQRDEIEALEQQNADLEQRLSRLEGIIDA